MWAHLSYNVCRVSGECRQLWRLAADISDHLSQYIHDHNSQQLHCNFTRLVPGNNLQQSLHSEILNIFEFYKYFWLQIFFLIKISWHKKYVFSDNIVRKSWFLPIISGWTISEFSSNHFTPGGRGAYRKLSDFAQIFSVSVEQCWKIIFSQCSSEDWCVCVWEQVWW